MDRTYGTFVIAVEQTSAEGLRVLTLDELKHQWLRVFDQEALTDALISNSMLSIDTLIDKFNQTYEYESGGDRE
jgi:hypothetical protein